MSEDSQKPDKPKQTTGVNRKEATAEGKASESPMATNASAGAVNETENPTEPTSAKNYEDWGKSLDQLSSAFTASARRWELIVYPSLFAFVLLAAYGFFLIYSLTKDIGRVADTMDLINHDMHRVAINMNSVSQNMVIMTQTVDNQSATMREMAFNMHGMNVSMAQMRYDIAIMNNSVSRPMSFMNSFMPW